jgi:hypothetical protein
MEFEVGAIAYSCDTAVRECLLDYALLCHFRSSTEELKSMEFAAHEYIFLSLSKTRDPCEICIVACS